MEPFKNTLDLSTAAKLDIIIDENHSYDIEINHFNEDGSAMTLTDDYMMSFAFDENGTRVAFSIYSLDHAELKRSYNKLIISVTAIANKLRPGNYYYDIRSDRSDGRSSKMYYGIATIHPSIAKKLA